MHDLIEIDDGNCPPYALAVPREKGAYASWLASLGTTTEIALLALDYLGGGGTLIDVGANIGAIAVPAAAAGSRVAAIELLPENFLYLALSALHNRLGNLRLFQLAAGEARGIVGCAGGEAWGHVTASGQGAPAAMLPLDDILALAALQQPGFIADPVLVKIDTEGHELPVLRGAARTLAAFAPAVIVECIMIEGRDAGPDRNALAVKRFLAERGYHLYLHRGHRLIPRQAEDVQEGHVADYFATRRRYAPGERIGRFTVGPLAPEESLAWIGEMSEWPLAWHRMHAAGVLARWIAEGRDWPGLAERARRLLADPDPEVAAFARSRL